MSVSVKTATERVHRISDRVPTGIAAQIDVIVQDIMRRQIIAHCDQLFCCSDLVRIFCCTITACKSNVVFLLNILHRSRYRLPDVGLGKRRQRQHLAQHRQCQHCCQQPHKFFHTRSSFFCFRAITPTALLHFTPACRISATLSPANFQPPEEFVHIDRIHRLFCAYTP